MNIYTHTDKNPTSYTNIHEHHKRKIREHVLRHISYIILFIFKYKQKFIPNPQKKSHTHSYTTYTHFILYRHIFPFQGREIIFI